MLLPHQKALHRSEFCWRWGRSLLFSHLVFSAVKLSTVRRRWSLRHAFELFQLSFCHIPAVRYLLSAFGIWSIIGLRQRTSRSALFRSGLGLCCRHPMRIYLQLHIHAFVWVLRIRVRSRIYLFLQLSVLGYHHGIFLIFSNHRHWRFAEKCLSRRIRVSLPTKDIFDQLRQTHFLCCLPLRLPALLRACRQ